MDGYVQQFDVALCLGRSYSSTAEPNPSRFTNGKDTNPSPASLPKSKTTISPVHMIRGVTAHRIFISSHITQYLRPNLLTRLAYTPRTTCSVEWSPTGL